MRELEALTEKIEALLTEPIAGLGMRLLEVQYKQEGRWMLRLFIEKEQGISLEDCGTVSELAGRLLDVEDIIPQAYTLEVSSPGLFRPLRDVRHYQQSLGRLARLNLKPGVLPELKDRFLRGVIEAVDGETVTLRQNEALVHLPLAGIKSAKLDPDL